MTAQGFPTCCDQALEQVMRVVGTAAASSAPNRVRAHNNDLQLMLDRELFCLSLDRKVCRLSHMQSHVLVRKIVAVFAAEEEKPFKDANHKTAYRYGLFESIFLGREGETILHNARLQVLFRVASFALQHPAVCIYIPLTQWLRKMLGRTTHPQDLVSMLVEHFIYPDPSEEMYKFVTPIVKESPEFGYIFTALAPNESNMGFAMAFVVAVFLEGSRVGEFLSMLEEYPEQLAAPFVNAAFPVLLRYTLQGDEDEEGEEAEKALETGSLVLTTLHHAMLCIVDNWQVKGVELKIDQRMLANLPQSERKMMFCAATETSAAGRIQGRLAKTTSLDSVGDDAMEEDVRE